MTASLLEGWKRQPRSPHRPLLKALELEQAALSREKGSRMVPWPTLTLRAGKWGPE